MKSEQLTKSLKETFDEERNRFAYRRAIVFWYDADATFEKSIREIADELGDVNLILLDEEPHLAVKIRLEIEDTAGDFLLYSASAEPSDVDTDWMLSIRLYSRTFRADETSLLMNELALTSAHWREFIKTHIKFFTRGNTAKLQRFGIADKMNEEEMRAKMLAVAANSNEEELSSVLMNLFSRNDALQGDLFAVDKIKNIGKYGLEDYFWGQIKNKFGYQKQTPELEDLLRRLFYTDFAGTVRGDLPEDNKHFRLPRQTSNLLAVWRDRQKFADDYRYYADGFEKEFRINNILTGKTAAELADTHTYAEVERHILREIRDALLKNQSDIAFEENLKLLKTRRNSFWSQNSAELFVERIDALRAALKFFQLKKKYADGFNYPSVETFFAAYAEEIYLFDQYYRHFYEFADKLDVSDFLKNLALSIEDCYLNWYMPQISSAWGKFITDANGFLGRWKVGKVPAQQNFYKTFVAPILEKYSQTTVYVIVSDAFRYEAAAELSDELNKKFGERKTIQAEISPQLGVLPSYTTLGMAALLPAENLSYSENGLDVLADGISTQGIINRRKVLKKYDGTAIHLKDFSKLKTEEGRELVRPHRVVYIYHDEIDSTGEKQVSEHKTFSAVRTTINKIRKTIDFIVKSLDGTHIFVTADHGFLFQHSKLEHHEKSSLDVKPGGMLKSNKRYLIGKNLGTNEKVWHGLTQDTADTRDEMEFWIPRGINRYRFSGGARFVHGGAMLQEIAVPVIYTRVLHGKKNARKAQNKLVDATLINQNIRIVTNIHRFEFLQTEAVSIEENKLPRTLSVSLRDGAELVSNEVKVVFDSTSGKLDDRRKDIQLFLKPGDYDRRREYRLVLRDETTDVQYNSYPVTIDLAFSSDF